MSVPIIVRNITANISLHLFCVTKISCMILFHSNGPNRRMFAHPRHRTGVSFGQVPMFRKLINQIDIEIYSIVKVVD